MNFTYNSVFFMPQLIYGHGTIENVSILEAKNFDHLIMTGIRKFVEQLLQYLNDSFTLGSTSSGTRIIRSHGMNKNQNEDFNPTNHADERLRVIETFPLSRSSRLIPGETLNPAEKSIFVYVNSKICWSVIASFPLCTFYSSYLKESSPENTANCVLYNLHTSKR